MRIDWLTFSAQIVNLLILVWLLQRFLYRPIIDAVAGREARIAARLHDAATRMQEADIATQACREREAEIARERDELLSKARHAADTEHQHLLDAARKDVERQRASWLESLTREQQALDATLRTAMATTIVRVARRTLADLADADLERQIVAAFLHQLDALPQSDRERLTQGGTLPRLVSSFPLDAAQREALKAAIGTHADPEFLTDERLVCGIAAAAGGYRVEWSVAAHLGAVEERVGALLASTANGDSRTA